MEDLQVSTVAQIKEALAGEVVSLPPFVPGTAFTARVRRVSIISLVKAGKIPNPLLQRVYALFRDKSFSKRIESGELEEKEEELKTFMEFINTVVKEALVSPSVSELEKEGILLTDEQKNAIFQYIQQGAAALGNFRGQSGSDESNTDGEGVWGAPQPDTTSGKR